MLRLTLRTLTVSRNVARTRWALMLLSASGTLPPSSPLPRPSLRPIALGLARARLLSLCHDRPGTSRLATSATIDHRFEDSFQERCRIATIPGSGGVRQISVRLRWRTDERWEEVVAADVADALPRTRSAR